MMFLLLFRRQLANEMEFKKLELSYENCVSVCARSDHKNPWSRWQFKFANSLFKKLSSSSKAAGEIKLFREQRTGFHLNSLFYLPFFIQSLFPHTSTRRSVAIKIIKLKQKNSFSPSCESCWN